MTETTWGCTTAENGWTQSTSSAKSARESRNGQAGNTLLTTHVTTQVRPVCGIRHHRHGTHSIPYSLPLTDDALCRTTSLG